MKVIFLDVNGVLFLTGDEVTSEHIVFNLNCMENLKKIIDSTFSNIVLTSTWRIGYMDPSNFFWKAILDNFSKYNMEDKIIGVTPVICNDFKEISRGLEINEWLKRNPDVDNYVILDDDEIKDIDNTRTIICDTFIGIDSYVASKAIKILNS